jgi:sec-independent protein translocase protein TatA
MVLNLIDMLVRIFIISLTSNFLIMIQPTLLGVLGTNEIIIILIIVLLLFGGKKIPELMRGLGKGVREFNDAKTNVKREIEESATNANNVVNDKH